MRSSGKFEVRDYPSLPLVETEMTRDGEEDGGSSGRLFGFLTGDNEATQKIATTTPVFMFGSDSNRTMAFVMPDDLGSNQLPKNTTDSVTVEELPAAGLLCWVTVAVAQRLRRVRR